MKYKPDKAFKGILGKMSGSGIGKVNQAKTASFSTF